MADSSITSTAAVSTQLRAQVATSLQGLRSAGQAQQDLVNQLQKTAAPAKASGVTLTARAVGPNTNLPRGSIVDRFV